MSNTPKKKSVPAVVLIAALLFAVILCLVVFSARGYQHAADLQDANGNMRAALSYIVSSVRDSGSSEISVEDRSGTECLIIKGEGYEQRFYLNEGRLLEEYTEPGSDIDPDTALEIAVTESLEFETGEDGMLTVRTDSGSASVNTRRKR